MGSAQIDNVLTKAGNVFDANADIAALSPFVGWTDAQSTAIGEFADRGDEQQANILGGLHGQLQTDLTDFLADRAVALHDWNESPAGETDPRVASWNAWAQTYVQQETAITVAQRERANAAADLQLAYVVQAATEAKDAVADLAAAQQTYVAGAATAAVNRQIALAEGTSAAQADADYRQAYIDGTWGPRNEIATAARDLEHALAQLGLDFSNGDGTIAGLADLELVLAQSTNDALQGESSAGIEASYASRRDVAGELVTIFSALASTAILTDANSLLTGDNHDYLLAGAGYDDYQTALNDALTDWTTANTDAANLHGGSEAQALTEFSEIQGNATTAFNTAIAQINADLGAGGSYNPPWTPDSLTASGHFGLPTADTIIGSRFTFSAGSAPSTFLAYLGGFYGWYGYGNSAFGDYHYWGSSTFVGAFEGYVPSYSESVNYYFYGYQYGNWLYPGEPFGFMNYIGPSYGGYLGYSSGLVSGLSFDFTLAKPASETIPSAIGQYRYNVSSTTFGGLVPMEPIAGRHDKLIPDESRPPLHSATVNPDVPALPGTLQPIQVSGPGTQHPAIVTGPDTRDVPTNSVVEVKTAAVEVVQEGATSPFLIDPGHDGSEPFPVTLPFQLATAGRPEFSEVSAREALIGLWNRWTDNGYKLAPQLLFWFLDKKTNDHDLSAKYSSMVPEDPRYELVLEKYVKELANRYGAGVHPLTDEPKAFSIEWLSFFDINYLKPFTSAGDLAYATGTGHFKYTNASLKVTQEQSGFNLRVTATFTATMTMYDSFAFWWGPLRMLYSDYRSGYYLQNIRHYDPVKWHVTWSESTTVTFTFPDLKIRTPRNVD